MRISLLAARHRRVARVERSAHGFGVVSTRVQVRVDAERDVRVSVSELAADEDDVEALRPPTRTAAVAFPA
jgi:hypothetical protein